MQRLVLAIAFLLSACVRPATVGPKDMVSIPSDAVARCQGTCARLGLTTIGVIIMDDQVACSCRVQDASTHDSATVTGPN